VHIDRAGFVQFALKEVPRPPDPEIGVISDFQRPAPGPFREPAPGIRLNVPDDAPEQELLVIRTARLAENVPILVLELPDGHVTQGLNLFPYGS
jgi:hypothetical protein